jgi:tetratricopeptide (TPR) repeat protein
MVNTSDSLANDAQIDALVRTDPSVAFSRAEAMELAGEFANAEKIYRLLLNQFPNHPALLHSLALTLKARGDTTEAENFFRCAITANPRDPIYYNNFGNLLRAKGQLAEAEANYVRALALKPDYIDAQYNLGVALEGLERADEALAMFRRAVSFDPSYFKALTRIGALLFHHSEFEDALRQLDAAIAVQPSYFDANYYRGLVLSGLERYEDAMAQLERALTLKPNSAETLAHLALIAARRSDISNARSYAERCLALVPSQPIALTALVMVDISEQAFTTAEQRTSSLLANDKVSGNTKAFAYGLLGDALDGQDLVMEAFASYKKANEESLQLYASKFVDKRSIEHIDELIAYFETTDVNIWRTPHDFTLADGGARQHIFLVGFMRSGTTLLENVLASHPDVVTLEERDIFGQANELLQTGETGMNRLAALTSEELIQYRNAYWLQASKNGVDVKDKVFVNKHPLNTIKLPLIARLFPHAKILFALRDPRDIILSCFRRHFGINAVTFELLTLEGATRFYDSVMRLAQLYSKILPLELYWHRHEDLVEDFDAQMQTICRFIGVEWTDEMRNFAEAARLRSIRSVSAAQVRRGLYREGMGQWQRYAKELAPILPVLQPWVERFGYDKTSQDKPEQ